MTTTAQSPRLSVSNELISALLGLAMMASAAFSPAVLNDGDTLLHITVGRWILEHRALPSLEQFSSTAGGKFWQVHEWLAETLLALSFGADRWSGVMLITGAAVGFASWQTARFVLARVALPYGLLALIVGIALAAPTLEARPHVLVLPLLAMVAIQTVGAFDANKAPSYWIIAAFPLWANLHASFPVGLGLIAVMGAGVVARTRSIVLFRQWGVVFAGAVGSTLISPYGLKTLLFPFLHVANAGLAFVGEWAATDFTGFNLLELAFALVVLAFFCGVRLPSPKLVLLAALAVMAVQHQRHWMLFGFIAPVLLAHPIGQKWRASERRSSGSGDPQPARPLLFTGGLAALLAGVRLAIPFSLPDGPTAPFAALASVPSRLKEQPVFNDYAFGGAMIFTGFHPAIDSRAELYGAEGLENYNRSITERCALIEELSRRDVRWSILATHNPALTTLEALPGWRKIYADALAVVEVRDGPGVRDCLP